MGDKTQEAKTYFESSESFDMMKLELYDFGSKAKVSGIGKSLSGQR
jgi:hypothetical protein